MNLYLPPDHPRLPWTGAFTGLMVLHFFYWGTNQYLVQRALAAKSLRHARYGILTGGFLKLLVPFISVAGGVAAAQLFDARGITGVAPDDAFPSLVNLLIPAGWGLFGLIAAGLLGAIISSIDSMMNSAATLVAMDIYKRYMNPTAKDGQMVFVGRIIIAVIVIVSALLAVFTYSPDSTSNFFLVVSSKGSYFTPGLVVAFFMGMFSRRATLRGIVSAILLCPIYSWLCEWGYNEWIGSSHAFFGETLNFMHRAFVAMLLSVVTVYALSTKEDSGNTNFLWIYSGGSLDKLKAISRYTLLVFVFLSIMIGLIVIGFLPQRGAGALSSFFIFGVFLLAMRREKMEWPAIFRDDRFYAGLLSACVTFVLFAY